MGFILATLQSTWTLGTLRVTEMLTRELLRLMSDWPVRSCDSNTSMYKRQPEYGPQFSSELGLGSIYI